MDNGVSPPSCVEPKRSLTMTRGEPLSPNSSPHSSSSSPAPAPAPPSPSTSPPHSSSPSL
ncbi:hypothetical protein JHK87_026938 [Glycine soja]|nr:hypothetical protein JHK87_026938 [Glycine soja]